MVRNRQYSIHFLKSSISRNSMLWQELLLKITIKTFTCQKLLFLLNFHTVKQVLHIYINFYIYTHKTIIPTFTQVEIRNTKLMPAGKSIWIKAEVPTNNRKIFQMSKCRYFLTQGKVNLKLEDKHHQVKISNIPEKRKIGQNVLGGRGGERHLNKRAGFSFYLLYLPFISFIFFRDILKLTKNILSHCSFLELSELNSPINISYFTLCNIYKLSLYACVRSTALTHFKIQKQTQTILLKTNKPSLPGFCIYQKRQFA